MEMFLKWVSVLLEKPSACFKELLHAETHLGPDGTRIKFLSQAKKAIKKHAVQVDYGNKVTNS